MGAQWVLQPSRILVCAMSAYDDLVHMVMGAPGKYTRRTLAAAMVLAHGGQPADHARRCRELVAGKALELRVNPAAKFRTKTLRLYPGSVTVATALAHHAKAP